MAQVPGLGLDQSQLADVINQQYKGYSQKQRNQMLLAFSRREEHAHQVGEHHHKADQGQNRYGKIHVRYHPHGSFEL